MRPAVVVFLGLLLPAPAHAATARVITMPSGPGHAPFGTFSRLDVAGDATAERLRLERAGPAIVVTSQGTPITAERGCHQAGPDRVVCRLPADDQTVDVRTGDGDDVVEVAGGTVPGPITLDGGAGDDRISTAVPARVDGGPGADRITGSPRADSFSVTAGDVIDGGAGLDVVDFSVAERGVLVDLASPDPQEGALLRNVDGVLGTRFPDDLRGTEGANLIDGRGIGRAAGRDRIDARGGDDAVRVSAPGLVDLGAGDDVLESGGLQQRGGRITCGAGHDELLLGGGAGLTPGCEVLHRGGLRFTLPTDVGAGVAARVGVRRSPRPLGGAWSRIDEDLRSRTTFAPSQLDVRLTAGREDGRSTTVATTGARALGRTFVVRADGPGALRLAIRVRRRGCRTGCGGAARLELLARP